MMQNRKTKTKSNAAFAVLDHILSNVFLFLCEINMELTFEKSTLLIRLFFLNLIQLKLIDSTMTVCLLHCQCNTIYLFIERECLWFSLSSRKAYIACSMLRSVIYGSIHGNGL